MRTQPLPHYGWVANDAPPPPNGRVGVTAVCLFSSKRVASAPSQRLLCSRRIGCIHVVKLCTNIICADSTPPPIKAWVANAAPPPPNGRVGVTAVCLSCWHPLYSPLCTYSSHVYFTTGPGIFHWLMNGQVACSKVHDIYGCILIDLPV